MPFKINNIVQAQARQSAQNPTVMYACKFSAITYKTGCANPFRGLDGCGFYLRTLNKPLSRLILRVAVFESTPYVPVRAYAHPSYGLLRSFVGHTFMQLLDGRACAR